MPTLEFNPATLLLVGAMGALFGGTSTVATYMAFKAAREVGEEIAPEEARIRIPLPPFTGEGRFLPPLPHEILAKMLEGAR